MASSAKTSKYLSTYAECEAIEVASRFPSLPIYSNCVVIPLYGEIDWPLTPMRSLIKAAETMKPQKTLAIIVLNHHGETSVEITKANRQLLSQFENQPHQKLATTPTSLLVFATSALDLLILNHTEAPYLFSAKEGVGIARKLGMDTAVAISQKGLLNTQHIHTTDGDAILAEDYFSFAQNETADIVLHPFRHEGLYSQSEALVLYELSLRYYVLGLQFAGSPYSFQTIGSTIAITPECYTAVRGFPKRNAAEDFYLLNKAAKTGRVKTKLGGEVILIGRESERVPFGTGVGTQKIWNTLTSGQTVSFYHPQIFLVLRALIAEMKQFSEHGELTRSLSDLGCTIEAMLGAKAALKLLQIIEETGITEILQLAASTRTNPAAILRHTMESFDAFRTLKLVHQLRDSLFPNMAWKECLKVAPFLQNVLVNEDWTDPECLLDALRRREIQLTCS